MTSRWCLRSTIQSKAKSTVRAPESASTSLCIGPLRATFIGPVKSENTMWCNTMAQHESLRALWRTNVRAPAVALMGPHSADVPIYLSGTCGFVGASRIFLPYNKVLLAPTKTHRPAKVISTRKSGCWPLYTWVGLQTAQQKQTYAQIKIRFKLKW